MYLWTKDGAIVDYALNKRIVQIGSMLIVDGQISKSPHPGAVLRYIPDQKIGWMFEQTVEGKKRDDLRYPDDVPTLPTTDDLKRQIDMETGVAIDVTIHPSAGTNESIGILRDQMVRWGNNLGLEFTLDFTRLNEVAVAAIGAARIKKESP